jgi:hypothetical protein
MPKPTRYPRKLRVKLEQIAAGREQRKADVTGQSADTSHGDSEFDPYRTFYRSFHRPGSIEVMLGRVDEVLHRLTIRHQMRAPATDFVTVKPPWLGAEPDASA